MPVDPAQVWSAEVDVSTPWKKRMRYTWVRYSENCVMGLAYESVADLIAKPRSHDWPDNDLYRLLFYMMRHVPGTAEAFADGFMKTCYRDCLEGELAT